MGKVFDCRFHDVIKNYVLQENGSYLAIVNEGYIPEYDDFLITLSGDILVFDYVNGDEARLIDPDMIVTTRLTPSYRDLKRAVLSQLKRDSK